MQLKRKSGTADTCSVWSPGLLTDVVFPLRADLRDPAKGGTQIEFSFPLNRQARQA